MIFSTDYISNNNYPYEPPPTPPLDTLSLYDSKLSVESGYLLLNKFQ